MKTLYFFTSSFPYGLGEMWKANELNFLVHHFDKIVVVPYSYAGNADNPKSLPSDVICTPPLFLNESSKITRWSVFQLLDRNLFFYLREFFYKKVYRNKPKFIQWLNASIQTKRVLQHPVIQEIIRSIDSETVLYFYWGKGACSLVPFVEKSKISKIVVRMHRHDLYEDQNNGYIPFRRPLLESLTLAGPTSLNGLEHLRKSYPDVDFDASVLRCGVIGQGLSTYSTDGTLRILTCSYLVPIKRVHLLIEALKSLDEKIEWTHLGDGLLMPEMKGLANALPSNIEVKFEGMIESEKVLDYYLNHSIDLFVNVSASEGVPFSIMEALSAGIPVLATGVGGTGEIIDDEVGHLLPAELTGETLASAIKSFVALPLAQKIAMRERANLRYRERCDAGVLAEELAKYLSSP